MSISYHIFATWYMYIKSQSEYPGPAAYDQENIKKTSKYADTIFIGILRFPEELYVRM